MKIRKEKAEVSVCGCIICLEDQGESTKKFHE
jgi:hypothetical protein